MHSSPLTFEGRRNALQALERGRKTVIRNHSMKRQAKEAAQQWLKDFSPESPLVDALVDVTHIAHGPVP